MPREGSGESRALCGWPHRSLILTDAQNCFSDGDSVLRVFSACGDGELEFVGFWMLSELRCRPLRAFCGFSSALEKNVFRTALACATLGQIATESPPFRLNRPNEPEFWLAAMLVSSRFF